MCGIAGVLHLTNDAPVETATVQQMLGMLRHRGPDGWGIYVGRGMGLGNTRLSIIDLSSGDQPIGNEDGTLWIVFNGEIFNYVELRPKLEARGHRFTTHSDTEVILHLYEDYGPDCLRELNGQFAIAIWDARKRQLFLARDRLGVRPLFYTLNAGRLVFGSEVKCLLTVPGVRAKIDPEALDEVFTYWSVLPPRTIFHDIQQLPPGHYALAHNGQLQIESYWTPDFMLDSTPRRSTQDYLAELDDLLIDATRLRLRADVPVGAYLSGGLDSSLTAAIARRCTSNALHTFSIGFVDREFDESEHQQCMAAALGTQHHIIQCSPPDIGNVFPEVIWHAETPILRTAPAPMFLLSKLVHDHQLKVVLTGEGADELFGGYDIFKEMTIRRFWAKRPDSHVRPLLLRRLYPDITELSQTNAAFLTAFFKKDLDCTNSPYYSHLIRWTNTARLRRSFLNRASVEPSYRPPYPAGFEGWDALAQAQYWEIVTFLSPYLLSSQGDRMAMAHSVEGRFPFLDCRLVEFCQRLPANLKLSGLTEKWLLRQVGKKLLPEAIWQRTKRPYRAPIQRSFFGANAPAYVRDLLSERAVREAELFNPTAVAQLARKAGSAVQLSEIENMALVGVLSTQLVYAQFVQHLRPPDLRDDIPLKVVEQP